MSKTQKEEGNQPCSNFEHLVDSQPTVAYGVSAVVSGLDSRLVNKGLGNRKPGADGRSE